MKSSHKTRLFVIVTSVVGLLLAIVFFSIVLGVRQKVLAHKQAEMQLAVSTTESLMPGDFDLEWFCKAYQGYSAALYSPDGRLLRKSGSLPLKPASGFSNHGDYVLLGVHLSGQDLVVSSGWTTAEHGLDDLALILTALWLPLTLLVGAATWLGAQSVFRPLERLSQQAAAISGSDLKERLAIQDRAEFGAFAAQLNQMLDRIEETVAREEEFAADAAHELRTPLAILRMQIETTLLKERRPAEYIASNQALLVEMQRLSQIVESLLQSARGELQTVEQMDLEPVVQETVARLQSAFEDKGARIQLVSQPVCARILHDEVRIVLDNLLGNALRFSPSGMAVEVSLRQQGGRAILAVQDHGPGISPELREKVFERFFRADTSRNRAAGGAGVGLAVCKRIIESRGGQIKIEDTGKGTCFVCILPVCEAEPSRSTAAS